MNKQAVIDWYITKFEAQHNDAPSLEMLAFLESHPELKAEIETLESFYTMDFDESEPSDAMEAKFYAELNEYKSANAQAKLSVHNKPLVQEASNDNSYSPWFARAASFAVVFTLGLLLGSKAFIEDDSKITQMQTDLAELNALVAISMLQQDNASKRLAAVSFTQKADVKSSGLINAMLDSLRNESSTAVKLALIRAFYDVPIRNIEKALIEIALEEEHQLVQIAISQLIMTRSSVDTRKEFVTAMRRKQVERDVIEFLEQYEARMRI